MNHRLVFSLLAVSLLTAAGCAENKHAVADRAQDGQVAVCAKCYEHIRTVRASGVTRGAPGTDRVIATHACADCKHESSVFMKDGVLMFRCPSCAPEGVACDRCVAKTSGK